MVALNRGKDNPWTLKTVPGTATRRLRKLLRLEVFQLVSCVQDVADLSRQRSRLLRRAGDSAERRVETGRADLEQVEREILQQQSGALVLLEQPRARRLQLGDHVALPAVQVQAALAIGGIARLRFD